MFDVGGPEILLIIIVVIVLFGPKKIPEVAQMIGKGMHKIRAAQAQFKEQIDEIQNEIKLDEKIMKLDCGEDDMLRLYNRPIIQTSIDEIVNNLKQIKNVTTQTLFTKGPHGNYTPRNIKEWTANLINISPKNVQIYTLDRGYPSDNIHPVEIDKLLKIMNDLNLAGVKADVF